MAQKIKIPTPTATIGNNKGVKSVKKSEIYPIIRVMSAVSIVIKVPNILLF